MDVALTTAYGAASLVRGMIVWADEVAAVAAARAG